MLLFVGNAWAHMTKSHKPTNKSEGLGNSFIVNEVMKTRLLPEMWRVILSTQFKDETQVREIITKYSITGSVNRIAAFFRPHQTRLRNIWAALVEGEEPPKEDWYYVQNYISKHTILRYDYQIVPSKIESKNRAIVIRRREPKGTVAVAYFTFMEALLTEIDGHNLGALMKSFNECKVCRNFFDPECFHNSDDYCSEYCRLVNKRTAQKVKHKKSKKK